MLRRVRRRVRTVVDALGTNPRPAAALWMWGEWEGHWRLRVGEYRIVYVIDDRRRRVIVVRVGHRSDVYQGGP